MCSIDCKLDECNARGVRSRAQYRDRLILVASFTAQQHQRAHAVDCYLFGRLSAELVIEDFERQGTLISGGICCLDKVSDGKITLTGKTAEVPAPRKNVKIELRSICELNEENAISGNRSNRSDWERR